MRRRSVVLALGIAALLIWTWAASSAVATPLIGSSATSASVLTRSASLLRIIFVDVGQGDSIILRQGSFTALIDGGPAGSQANIEAQLSKAGAKRIDTLVITHSHADHIGGLPDIIARFRPRKVVYASEGTTATWRKVKGALKGIGAVFQKVRTGASVAIGKLKARVLSPTTISGQPNDDSVVLLLAAGASASSLPAICTGPTRPAWAASAPAVHRSTCSRSPTTAPPTRPALASSRRPSPSSP